MKFRKAEFNDLEKLKSMYRALIRSMEEKDVNIWDEYYPCELFAGDIEKGRLYILEDEGSPVSAFALCENAGGESALHWKYDGKSLYIDRLGVDPEYQGRGIGTLTLKKAAEAAKAQAAENLRLFVVDLNFPAIKLYEKSGFTRAEGIYNEVIDSETTLREYGYELKIQN